MSFPRLSFTVFSLSVLVGPCGFFFIEPHNLDFADFFQLIITSETINK